MKKSPVDPKTIIEEYLKGDSQRTLSDRYKISCKRIRKILIAANVEIKTRRKFDHTVWGQNSCNCDDCKQIRIDTKTDFKKKNPLYVRRTNLQQFHNMTLEEYNTLLEIQNGVCACCHNPETHKNQYGPIPLCVDHDRTCCPGDKSCGKCTRGLLCHRCNTAEGLLGTIENVRNLLIYMERTQL